MKKKQSRSALAIVRKYYPQVKSVKDAKKNAGIEVTKTDCKRSQSGAPSKCAMATAFERVYDGAIISLSCAYLITGDQALRYTVPGSVSRELVSFDRHHDFAPGKYHLVRPSKSQKLQARKLRLNAFNPDRHNTPKTKRHKHVTAGIRSL